MVPKSETGRQTERLGTGQGLPCQLFSTWEMRSQSVSLVVSSMVFSSEWSGVCSLLPGAWLGSQAVPLAVALGFGCAPAGSAGASLLRPGRVHTLLPLGLPWAAASTHHLLLFLTPLQRVPERCPRGVQACSNLALCFQNLRDLRLQVVLQHLPGSTAHLPSSSRLSLCGFQGSVQGLVAALRPFRQA